MTKEEFATKIRKNKPGWLVEEGGSFDIVPCDCGDAGCEGWKLETADALYVAPGK